MDINEILRNFFRFLNFGLFDWTVKIVDFFRSLGIG